MDNKNSNLCHTLPCARFGAAFRKRNVRKGSLPGTHYVIQISLVVLWHMNIHVKMVGRKGGESAQPMQSINSSHTCNIVLMCGPPPQANNKKQ